MTAVRLAQTTALTIGNFDGAHVGHAALVRAARAAATAAADAKLRAAVGDARVVVLSFDPSPLTVLRPEVALQSLTTFVQRARLLAELGADEVVALRPTPDFLQQSPGQFIQWCVAQWRPSFFVEGADFRFGRGRAGSIATLRQFEAQFGFRTIVVDPVEVALADQSIVEASSSLTRWLLAHGRVQDASVVLGKGYEIEAEVVRGDQRGRGIGFPTANLGPAPQILPADGIYAGVAKRDGAGEWLAAISVGIKPTFGQNPRTCEAHLLDYHGPVDDYGWTIRLRFTHWLRDQLSYDSVDALIAQLHRDIANVRAHASQGPGTATPGLWGTIA